MLQFMKKRVFRGVIATLASVLLLGIALGSTSSIEVTDTATLEAALASAGSGDVIIFKNAGATIALNGGSVPTGVTLNLNGGTLELDSGTLGVSGLITGGNVSVYGGSVLDVGGTVAGGTVNVYSGTVLRETGSSITSTISLSSDGTVRGPVTLNLENLDTTSGELIDYVTYEGGGNDNHPTYIQRNAAGVIYVKMTGTNYSTPMTVKAVMTQAGNYFRLGTRNTSTLSLVYTISYSGLSGASLTSANPSSYTASDTATTLNNPTKDGFTFDGWTCPDRGVTTPTTTMVIPEGTTGALAFVANWTEDTLSGGTGGKTSGSGSSSSSSSATTSDTSDEDAEALQDAAAAADTASAAATTTDSGRRTKVASSSTKVTFSSNETTIMPTLETVSEKHFPWGWTIGGVAALSLAAYAVVKAVQRKKMES